MLDPAPRTWILILRVEVNHEFNHEMGFKKDSRAENPVNSMVIAVL